MIKRNKNGHYHVVSMRVSLEEKKMLKRLAKQRKLSVAKLMRALTVDSENALEQAVIS